MYLPQGDSGGSIDKKGRPITPTPATTTVTSTALGLTSMFKAEAQAALAAAGVTAGFAVVGMDGDKQFRILGTFADLATARAARAQVRAPIVYAAIFEPVDGAWRRYDAGYVAAAGRPAWLVPAAATLLGVGALYLITRRRR